MMEKYADNLEELVMERTGQLIEEKKKTDALLERMLPRFFSLSLKEFKTENTVENRKVDGSTQLKIGRSTCKNIQAELTDAGTSQFKLTYSTLVTDFG